MPSTYTPNLNLELQANGENVDTWGIRFNNNDFTPIDSVLGGVLPLSLSNANITLTTTQTQNNVIVLTGILTANVAIIFPQIGRNYFVINNTTGAFAVTLKTTAVSGAVYIIPQGQKRYVTLNGTDVLVGQNGIGAQASIASATTTDLGTVSTQNALITGTATITSFGSSASAASPIYQVMFAGPLVLTYNATSLITPSAGNIYTQAGDTAVLLYLGSANWQVLSYSANTFIPGVQPVAGGFRNLVITGTGNATATLTADALTLEDSTGRAYRARGVSLSLNLGSTGANGLDTGSETANTWYSLWAIYNQTTNTLACLASISATAPTLPAGYTYKARFGWLRNDASANLWRSLQYGKRVQIVAGTNPGAPPVIVSGNNGAVLTAAPLANFLPPTAAVLHAVARYQFTEGYTFFVGPNSSYNISTGFLASGIAGSSVFLSVPFSMVLESANIYYASNNSNSIAAVGWEDNL